MLHCDPESLALRSLGEGGASPDEEAHLATCAQCQAELASLRAVVTTARDGGPVEIEQPSPAVWDRIRTELALSTAAPAVTHGTVSAPRGAGLASDPVPSQRDAQQPAIQAPTAPGSGTPGSGSPAEPAGDAPVVSLDARRARRSRPAMWLMAAAAVGGIAVGGVVTAALMSTSSAPQATVAASVDLAPLPDWDAAGTADLTVTEDGQQVLVVTVDADAPASDGFQEVWLIDTEVSGMVSLGILDGTTGEFAIPAGVDVGDFPIVDVSLEPFDGDPTHSGDSIVRGQIEA